jgi:hypothetical protein
VVSEKNLPKNERDFERWHYRDQYCRLGASAQIPHAICIRTLIAEFLVGEADHSETIPSRSDRRGGEKVLQELSQN